MSENEIIIDKKLKTINITNKNKYNKLIIAKKTNPMFLNSFKNIEELVIDGSYYNEERIHKLSFKDSIKKLEFKKIFIFGRKSDSSGYGRIYYKLDTPNLKILEFCDIVHDIDENYIEHLSNLETLIFNVSKNTRLDLEKKKILLPSSLKNIVLKTEYNTFEINFDYTPIFLYDLYCNDYGITLVFSNDLIKTNVSIDNNNISKTNILKVISDDLVIDNCFYIPDYVNDIDINSKITLKKIDSISLNPKKLAISKMSAYRELDKYLSNIEKIIIRDDDEMRLNPSKELTASEFGEIEKIFIKEGKLYINFKHCKFVVDEEGNIRERTSEEIVESPTEETEIQNLKDESNLDKDNYLNNYTSKQLEYYSYYKKIVELLNNDDKELNNAMKVIKDRLVKKLKIDN